MFKKRLTALLLAAALTAGCTLAALAETPEPAAPEVPETEPVVTAEPESAGILETEPAEAAEPEPIEAVETVTAETVEAPQYDAAAKKLATPKVEWGLELAEGYTDSVASWDKVPNARSYKATLFAWNDDLHANVPVHTFTVPQPGDESEKVWVPFCVYADENTGYYMDVVAMNREDGYEDSDHGQTDGHLSRDLMGTPWESIERVATPTDVHWDEDHNAIFTLGEGNGARVDVYKFATNELVYSDCFYGPFGQWLGEQMFPLSEVMEGLPAGDYYFTVVASDSFSGMRNSLPSEHSMTYHKVDTTQIKEFITRLYGVCLGREPDAAGLKNWTDHLLYDGWDAANVVYGFMIAPEFANKNYCNEHFVEYLYNAFFGRASDEAGMQNWLDHMAGGMERERVLEGFAVSAEFTQLCNSYGITAVAPGKTEGNIVPRQTYGMVQRGSCAICGKKDNVTAFVERLYRECLNREGEAAGIATWTDHLWSHRKNGREVVKGFALSDEMTLRGLSDEQFIEMLYRAMFGREYDAPGKAIWMDHMEREVWSREQVVDGFADSPEFDNLCRLYCITRG